MADLKITSTTLIPIYLVGAVASGVFWLAVLFKDVQANAAEIVKMQNDRSTLEVELMQRMSSQEVTLNIIQSKAAEIDGKLSMLIKWSKSTEQ